MTTPADELRTAARRLRELTGRTSKAPWTTTWNAQQYELAAPSSVYPITEWTYAIVTIEPAASEQRAECDTADADYIAAVHPGVGLALADWLDVAAEHCRAHYLCCDNGPCSETAAPALAVARAITGGEQR
ncbi:hypothetical protein ACFXKI_09840 [Streptomyces mirabilis]|uniref:hypothetical protein n=1 Tax=Streptomyces mirabilis TaxID=68239 RepID=UPI00367C52E0